MSDLSVLKDFLVLAEVRNFGKAAERCHVSVSGLSRRIQSLESWLGAPIIHHGKRHLELTDTGRRLLGIAEHVVGTMADFRASVRSSNDDRDSRIRFVAPHILSAIFFPRWIPRLHSDFRIAKITVNCEDLAGGLQSLDDDKSDFAIALFDTEGRVAAKLDRKGDFASYDLLQVGEDHLLPVSAPNAAGRPLFDLGEDRTPQALSFLGYDSDCHLGWALGDPEVRWPQLALQRVHHSSLTDGLRNLATSALGVAWLPQTLVMTELATKTLVRAGSRSFDIPLRACILRRRQPLGSQAERLWTHLTELNAQAGALDAQKIFGAPATDEGRRSATDAPVAA